MTTVCPDCMSVGCSYGCMRKQRDDALAKLAAERARTDTLISLHWKWDSAPPDSTEERAALDEIDEACREITRSRAGSPVSPTEDR